MKLPTVWEKNHGREIGKPTMQRPPLTRFESHYGDRTVRCFVERPNDLYAMFMSWVERKPSREAVVAEGGRYTCAEFEAWVSRLSAGLAARGLGKGDRIALLLDNGPEFVAVLFAAWRLGAIVVPVNTREQAPELRHLLGHAGAKIVVHEAALAPLLPDGSEFEGGLRRISTSSCSGSEPLSAVSDEHSAIGPAKVDEEDCAVLLYTSGTTGKPKAAMLTHLSIAHSALHYRLTMGLTESDRVLSCVPLSHVTGLVAMIAATVASGGTLLILRTFKAERFMALAEQERMTYTLMVPAMYNLCAMRPEFSQCDLSSWRIGGYGGAPMPPSLIARLAQMLPSLALVNVYGATETTSPATMMVADANGRRNDSVGQAVVCGHVLVMDETGAEVPRGSAGELWIGGPMVACGYWADEAATAREFTAGYWHSGDIGSIDEQGFVRVFDRKKDMINRGGYKIYAVEVESVLVSHPSVTEAAVVAKPCEVLGERVHAFVVQTDADAAIDAEALKAFCAAQLADYKVPESFTLLQDALPRNANGKILKRSLRESLWTDDHAKSGS